MRDEQPVERRPAMPERSDEGPWGVYDCYCLRCGTRYVSVAPVQTEAVELWECPDCRAMTVTWHPHPEAETVEEVGDA